MAEPIVPTPNHPRPTALSRWSVAILSGGTIRAVGTPRELAQLADAPTHISYTAPDGTARLGSWAVVRQAPWIVWVDIRTTSILAPARRFLGVMALAGLLILIVGAIGASGGTGQQDGMAATAGAAAAK